MVFNKQQFKSYICQNKLAVDNLCCRFGSVLFVVYYTVAIIIAMSTYCTVEG